MLGILKKAKGKDKGKQRQEDGGAKDDGDERVPEARSEWSLQTHGSMVRPGDSWSQTHIGRYDPHPPLKKADQPRLVSSLESC